jgi:transcriptional regulator with PAS, ATPase and Fis domain
VLLQHVTRGWEQANLVRENRRLRRELAEQNQRLRAENEALRGREGQFLEVFSGTHPLISELEQRARDYAATDKPVLISGETGTGKELVARALHSFSSRSDRPFLAVNCSALQESLLESQLFGYSRGAFTGADRNRQGILRAVDGGTLFLDEVGDLPLSLQPRLLRVLQFGTFIPVGETAERKVDVRILAATNRSLHREVEAGRFRRDLYYRINTLQLELLPLRERPLDIPTIMGRIAKAGGIAVPELTERAAEVLQSHPFPGNVRELQSVLDRLMIVCRRRGTHVVDVGMMRESIQPTTPSEVTSNCGVDTLPPIPPPGEELDLSGYLETMRRAVIEAVLRQEDGNISRTARRLKMSRQGLKNALLRFSATAQNGKS